jgi:hypothetical protein
LSRLTESTFFKVENEIWDWGIGLRTAFILFTFLILGYAYLVGYARGTLGGSIRAETG